MEASKNLSLGIVATTLILFQLMSPLQVLADGEPATPTEAPTEATAQPVDPSPTPADPGMNLPTETSPLVPIHENGLKLNKETTEANSLDISLLPPDTNMVVLGNDGQPVPLASQQAAEAIVTSDPIWCPAGQAPTPGANGCTVGYISLAELVRNEAANIVSDGTIWITSGPTFPMNSRQTNVVACVSFFNGQCNGPTAWSNYALTLQGGWSGIVGDTTIGLNTVLTDPVNIQGWNNDITINDLTISLPHPGSGCGNLCIFINSGNIVLNDVDAQNDHNEIVSVALQTNEGNILVSNSDFEGNTWGGLSATTLNGNIDVIDGHFDNLYGNAVYLTSLHGNIFISDSSFNDNGYQGLQARTWGGNIEILHSSFNNNVIGLQLNAFDPNSTVTISESSLVNNNWGLWTPMCAAELQLNNVDFSGNTIDIESADDVNTAENIFAGCAFENAPVIRSSNTKEFDPDSPTTLTLPNGDLVNISDPVNGSPQISPLANADLPADLPEGFTYISAFTLDILQNGQAILVLTDGGSIQVSFTAPSAEQANTYSVLYWDNGTWVTLQDFASNENGSTQAFDLDSGNPEENRKILSGVRLITAEGDPRVEVSTNFPGIFVLAQH